MYILGHSSLSFPNAASVKTEFCRWSLSSSSPSFSSSSSLWSLESDLRREQIVERSAAKFSWKKKRFAPNFYLLFLEPRSNLSPFATTPCFCWNLYDVTLVVEIPIQCGLVEASFKLLVEKISLQNLSIESKYSMPGSAVSLAIFISALNSFLDPDRLLLSAMTFVGPYI